MARGGWQLIQGYYKNRGIIGYHCGTAVHRFFVRIEEGPNSNVELLIDKKNRYSIGNDQMQWNYSNPAPPQIFSKFPAQKNICRNRLIHL
jgi:hypothetical protein